MTLSEKQKEAKTLVEIMMGCGRVMMEDLRKACRDRNLEDGLCWTTDDHLEVVKGIWDRWHTTSKFQVGDKVHVLPTGPTRMKTCIRATITEVGSDGWGYRLRAFKRDLPGIYLFNIWDFELVPRLDRRPIPTPPELVCED